MPFRLHNRHPIPVGFEFIGDELRHRRRHLLTHIGAVVGDAHSQARSRQQRCGGLTAGRHHQ
jgi:hypothetical protein